MDVNKQNYEEFILDYLEGELDDEVHNQMRIFLDNHPEIYAETKDLLNYRAPKEEVVYNYKQSLRKTGKSFSLPMGIIGFSSGIAASFLLFATYIYITQTNTSNNTTQSIEDPLENKQVAITELEEETPVLFVEEKIVQEHVVTPKPIVKTQIKKRVIPKSQVQRSNPIAHVQIEQTTPVIRERAVVVSQPIVSTSDVVVMDPVQAPIKINEPLKPIPREVLATSTASKFDGDHFHHDHDFFDCDHHQPMPNTFANVTTENNANPSDPDYYFDGFYIESFPSQNQPVTSGIVRELDPSSQQNKSLIEKNKKRILNSPFIPKSFNISIKKSKKEKKSKQ